MERLAGSSRLLRAMNESASLAYLFDRGPLTRGALRELTGLSKPTTSEVLRRLTDAGLAIVIGHTSGGPGPNAEIYAANPEAGYAVGVSVRETRLPSLALAVCDINGAVLARAERAADFARVEPEAAITAAVEELCTEAGTVPDRIRHVQLGVPGSYDPTSGVIRHIDVPGWNRPGLVDRLADRLGVPVAVENDVNLAAVAERAHGVARDVDGFALVWFSFGLGLAIDLGGQLLRGARGGAGEIGYVPVGLRGGGPGTDLHDLVGGQAVQALAAAHGLRTAGAADAVAAAVASGADEFLSALADRIAVGIAAVAAVLDPPLVVLAGDVAQAGGDALRDAVVAALRATTPLDTPIAVTGVTDDAVLLGALDCGVRAVRETLVGTLRDAIPPS
ncbi:MAG TPA: ROK family transcriptional regulator [Micromonosporaceae bacterium]